MVELPVESGVHGGSGPDATYPVTPDVVVRRARACQDACYIPRYT